MNILIFGNSNDYEIISFLDNLYKYNYEFNLNHVIIPILLENNYSPSITWDYNEDILIIDGMNIKPDVVWFRRYVLHDNNNLQLRSKRLHHIIQGWLLSHPDVKIINRNWLNKFNNKIYQLNLAKKIGMKIPNTVLTNSVKIMEIFKNNSIIKPIDNGYCCELKNILDNLIDNNDFRINNNNELVSSSPAFIQEKLLNPEYRIYFIFGNIVAFKIESNKIDHRTDENSKIYNISTNEIGDELLIKIGKLFGLIDLDFGALDFKINDNNELIFLEVNDFPMFSKFDKISSNKISTFIFNNLLK